MIPAFIQNSFINKVLGHLLDGNKGSNALTVVVGALLAQKIDFARAFAWFGNPGSTDGLDQAAMLVVGLILAVYGYFVGKKPAAVEGSK
jgi:hypothetical protein